MHSFLVKPWNQMVYYDPTGMIPLTVDPRDYNSSRWGNRIRGARRTSLRDALADTGPWHP